MQVRMNMTQSWNSDNIITTRGKQAVFEFYNQIDVHDGSLPRIYYLTHILPNNKTENNVTTVGYTDINISTSISRNSLRQAILSYKQQISFISHNYVHKQITKNCCDSKSEYYATIIWHNKYKFNLCVWNLEVYVTK